MRAQIPKLIGGTVRAVFPGPPTGVTVTVTGGGGSNLITPVVDAAGTPSDLALTVNPDDTADADPVAGDLSLVVGCLKTRLPRIGEAFELASAATLERQIQTVRAFRKTGESTADSDNWILEIDVTDPLVCGFTTGDTGTGIEASIVISGANCPNIAQNHRAVFTATVNGFEVRRETIFDVGLRESYNPATVADLRQAWPDHWRSELEEWAGLRGLPALVAGYDRLETRIFATGRNPNRIRDTRPLVPLIINRAFREMAVFGLVPSTWTDKIPEYIAFLDRDFDALLIDSLSGVQWYDDFDSGNTGAGGPGGHPVTRGRIRLSR